MQTEVLQGWSWSSRDDQTQIQVVVELQECDYEEPETNKENEERGYG